MATNYTTEADVIANKASVNAEIAAKKADPSLDWPTLLWRPILGITANDVVSLGLLASTATASSGSGLTAAQLAQLNSNAVDISQLQQTQSSLATAQTNTSAVQAALSQELEEIGEPIKREGSPYTLQVVDKHYPVIVNNSVVVPSFTVGEAPATINVFNSSTNTVAVSGSNYTGIIEIEGKGVATFFITTDGTSVTTEGVGGRS